MTLVTMICLLMLVAAGLLSLARVVRPASSVADRMVALDLLLLIVVTGIAVQAVRTSSGVFLDLLVVVSLIGFVGTVMTARFIERRGA